MPNDHQTSRFSPEERAEIKAIVFEAMSEFFSDKGKMGKHLLITAATIVGSLVVIFGGLKAVLGWLGFHYLPK